MVEEDGELVSTVLRGGDSYRIAPYTKHRMVGGRERLRHHRGLDSRARRRGAARGSLWPRLNRSAPLLADPDPGASPGGLPRHPRSRSPQGPDAARRAPQPAGSPPPRDRRRPARQCRSNAAAAEAGGAAPVVVDPGVDDSGQRRPRPGRGRPRRAGAAGPRRRADRGDQRQDPAQVRHRGSSPSPIPGKDEHGEDAEPGGRGSRGRRTRDEQPTGAAGLASSASAGAAPPTRSRSSSRKSPSWRQTFYGETITCPARHPDQAGLGPRARHACSQERADVDAAKQDLAIPRRRAGRRAPCPAGCDEGSELEPAESPPRQEPPPALQMRSSRR